MSLSSTMMIRKRNAAGSLSWKSPRPSFAGESKMLPRLKSSSDQVGSTESSVSAGSDHDDIDTEEAGGGYITPPISRKRRRLSMSPEINEIPTDEVREEIMCLLDYVPKLKDIFTIVNKIGEGTFSSVYLAKVLGHRGGLDQTYALKHIIPTSHPDRILSELSCLTTVGGHDNVIGVKLCLRERDHVILAMPYFPHQKFQDYVRDMSLSEIKEYIYNLLLALCRVHQFNVIHRDVKPSNFLYNRTLKKYALVDFGLAQKVSPAALRLQHATLTPGRSSTPSNSESQSSTHHKTRGHVSAVEQTPSPSNLAQLKRRASESVPPSPRLTELNINTFTSRTPYKSLINEKKEFHSPRSIIAKKRIMGLQIQQTQVLSLAKPSKKVVEKSKEISTRPRSSSASNINLQSKGMCNCFGQPQVCSLCMGRSNQQAPRAGTPGFRAPEVLMKYPHQTTAVDIWATGVIVLSILSGRYPFFKAQDDMTALMQIMSIFGSDAMVQSAQKYGKNLMCGIKLQALNLKQMCKQLRNPQDGDLLRTRRRSHSSERTATQDLNRKQKTSLSTPGQSATAAGSGQRKGSCTDRSKTDQCHFPDTAYDLLSKLLDLNPATRISAKEALTHPFLSDDST